jgi:DNA-binding beta-propeller fold protein YncE
MSTEIGIPFRARADVRAVLGQLSRTEDLRFSPSNRRLAVADYGASVIAVFDISISGRPGSPTVALTGARALRSPRLSYPHGLAFLDEDTLLVANRGSDVSVVQIVSSNDATELVLLDLPRDAGFQGLCAPGSLDVSHGGQGRVEVFVCNNSDEPAEHTPAGELRRMAGGTITHHTLRVGARPPKVESSAPLLRRWLDVPDGICVSPSGEWMAVSNHYRRVVMVYDRSAISEESDPKAILRGVSYPHGLRFTADARRLYVADGGAPYVHVFEQTGRTWDGVQHPRFSLQVMDEALFQSGPQHPEDGGPKGLDIDRTGGVLAVTSERVPLAFFDVESLDRAGEQGCPDGSLQVAYELGLLETATEASNLAARRIAALEHSLSMRVTKPLRSARGAWRRCRRMLRHR